MLVSLTFLLSAVLSHLLREGAKKRGNPGNRGGERGGELSKLLLLESADDEKNYIRKNYSQHDEDGSFLYQRADHDECSASQSFRTVRRVTRRLVRNHGAASARPLVLVLRFIMWMSIFWFLFKCSLTLYGTQIEGCVEVSCYGTNSTDKSCFPMMMEQSRDSSHSCATKTCRS